MFEHVGKDLDPSADRRHAASLMLITALLAGATAAIVAIAAWRTTELVLGQVDDIEVAFVEIGDDDPELGGAPPPPAPRAAPPTATAADPDPEAVASLEVPPEAAVTDPVPASGTAEDAGSDGLHGGIGRGGSVPGTNGGGGGGDGHGDGDIRVLHHSEVVVKRRVSPAWPADADADTLGVASVDCRVSVRVDRSGAPTGVDVLDCPAVFHASVREALLRWRWFPAEVDGAPVAASFQLIVRYRRP
jgi:hypothetical protein